MKIVKTNPRIITDNRIITERHKAIDIIRMNLGWHKVSEVSYKGITFWELVRYEGRNCIEKDLPGRLNCMFHKPVYCKDCHSRNSWQPNPVRDIHGAETGRVLWRNYRCKVCGATTIAPVELDFKGTPT